MCAQVSHLYPAAKYVLPKLLLGPIYHFIYYGDVLKVGGRRFYCVCCFQITKDTRSTVVSHLCINIARFYSFQALIATSEDDSDRSQLQQASGLLNILISKLEHKLANANLPKKKPG